MLLTDQRTLESPRKYRYNAPTDTTGENSAAFARTVESSQDIYVVWIDNADTQYFSYLYTPQELANVVDLEAVATTPDGAIYHVMAKHA